MRLAAVALATVLCACGSLQRDVAGGAPVSPSLVATSAKPTPTPSPSPTPSGKTAPFPDLPVVVGTPSGDVYLALQSGVPSGQGMHICDGSITALATYGRQVAIACGAGAAARLYLLDVDTRALQLLAKTEVPQYLAFDGLGGLAYVTIGQSVPSAPIPTTKLVLRDLRTGSTTVIDERFGVAFDLALTEAGVAVWRPRNSLSFVRPDAEVGTWVIHNGSLFKFTQHRLVYGGQKRALLESEPANGSGGATYVLWKTDTEVRLTPIDVANEKAVTITPDGRAVVWRPRTSEFEGAMVIYRGTTEERVDMGRFSAFKVMDAGDWQIGLEYFGAPSLTLRAYRISDGAFAALPVIGITAIALLGPRKVP